MQDFTSYSFTIQLDKLEEETRAAIKAGYSAYIIINGEIYDIATEAAVTEK